MPNCLTLTSKATNEPTSFVQIDEEICAHLGVPVHPTKYVHGWYDTIGLCLAMGKTFDEQRRIFAECPELLKIIDYLDEHYIPDSWAEIGRR